MVKFMRILTRRSWRIVLFRYRRIRRWQQEYTALMRNSWTMTHCPAFIRLHQDRKNNPGEIAVLKQSVSMKIISEYDIGSHFWNVFLILKLFCSNQALSSVPVPADAFLMYSFYTDKEKIILQVLSSFLSYPSIWTPGRCSHSVSFSELCYNFSQLIRA